MPMRARSRFRSCLGGRMSSPSKDDLAGGALVRIEVVHAVEDAQQGGLAAAGRADEGCRLVGVERQADVLQRVALAVVEIEIADRHLPASPAVSIAACGVVDRSLATEEAFMAAILIVSFSMR